MKGVIVKVLTKNVKLIFECETDECRSDKVKTDIIDLIESGHPICPVCQSQMTLNDECLITN